MTYLADNMVKWIVVHYSATPIEQSVSSKDIDRMHKKRGFNKIGYHLYGRIKGGVEKGRDLDQPGHFEMGAHSKGENDESVGYCFEGGVTKADPDKGFDTRTPEQIEDMIREIEILLIRFPNAKVVGHRDMPGAATQCPGFDVIPWWADVQAKQSKGLWAAIFLAIAGMFRRKK